MQSGKYYVRINKRLRYIRVYEIKQKIGRKKENPLTKLMIKLFNKKGSGAQGV
ncbi:MAG: hypothetical protein QXN59_01230 [Candidatus Micrarchaeaceae archaeon]